MHVKEVHRMRATLNIPDALVAEVQRLSGVGTKTGAIVTAMEDYIRRHRTEELLTLRGKIAVDYDWRKEEEIENNVAEKREKYRAR
jgi:hypothetical protein